jgi:hypothetical protein
MHFIGHFVSSWERPRGGTAYRVRLLLPLLIAEIKAGAYWDRAKGR